MTIGIAAYGPNAGRAVLRALASVEAVGRGAIGGFVSMVALASSGDVIHAETQDGGTGRLFSGGPAFAPIALLDAPVAGLMSSGPDRPEPLRQFTPALGGVGLVTGHRMPNTVGANGVALNEEVLALMQRGLAPEEAVTRVVSANPHVDAGIIALSADGHIFAADTVHVRRRGDAGRALSGSHETGAVVAVLHNAIHPFRPLAMLASEVALDTMQPADKPDGWIRFHEGVQLRRGPANAVNIAADGLVDTIFVKDERFLAGSWSLGLGHEAAVVQSNEAHGIMVYEPYLTVQDGQLRTIDGKPDRLVPIRCMSPSP